MTDSENSTPAPALQGTLSRRKFLRTASVASLAVVVPAGAAMALSGHPDAELLALGAQIDAIKAERERNAPHYAELEAKADAIMASAGRPTMFSSEWWQAFLRARDESGFEVAIDADIKLLDALEAIYTRARAIEPKTFAGLAVRAREVRDHASPLWGEPEESQDWDKFVIRKFVDLAMQLGAPAQGSV